jgi:hypothetical protein
MASTPSRHGARPTRPNSRGSAPQLAQIRVFRLLKGGAPYFGAARDEPDGFRPFGEGGTPEETLQACLESACIHHWRGERQR